MDTDIYKFVEFLEKNGVGKACFDCICSDGVVFSIGDTVSCDASREQFQEIGIIYPEHVPYCLTIENFILTEKGVYAEFEESGLSIPVKYLRKSKNIKDKIDEIISDRRLLTCQYFSKKVTGNPYHYFDCLECPADGKGDCSAARDKDIVKRVVDLFNMQKGK